MRLKQFCTRKVPDFAMALRARKVSGSFEKRPRGLEPSNPRPPAQQTGPLPTELTRRQFILNFLWIWYILLLLVVQFVIILRATESSVA